MNSSAWLQDETHALNREHAETEALLFRRLVTDLDQFEEDEAVNRYRLDIRALHLRFNAQKVAILAAAEAWRAVEVERASAQVIGGAEVAEEAALGQVIG